MDLFIQLSFISYDNEKLAARMLPNKNNRSRLLSNKKNIDQVITFFKPTIFWKDKEVVKQQISFWPLKKIEKLIIKINEVEIIIKKNYTNSINKNSEDIQMLFLKTENHTNLIEENSQNIQK